VVCLEDELGFGAPLQLFVEYVPEKSDFAVLEVEVLVGVLGDPLLSEKIVIQRD